MIIVTVTANALRLTRQPAISSNPIVECSKILIPSQHPEYYRQFPAVTEQSVTASWIPYMHPDLRIDTVEYLHLHLDTLCSIMYGENAPIHEHVCDADFSILCVIYMIWEWVSDRYKYWISHMVTCVAYFIKEIDPSLAKLPLEFNGYAAKLGLTHCGLVKIYGDIELSRHWFR